MTIEKKIHDCMQGRSIIPEEYEELMLELSQLLQKLNALKHRFKDRMKQESPIQVGDKVQVWGGGLTTENVYNLGVFFIRDICIYPNGSFKYLFYNCKKDGTQGRMNVNLDYSEIEKLG